jgi:hypothetical protein
MRKTITQNTDAQMINTVLYNDKSGAQKNMSVGQTLIAIKLSETSYTTNCTSASRQLVKGSQLAIYNNNNAVGAIKFSTTSTITVGTPGVADANGDVAIICKPNDWTYICSGDKTWVRASDATLLVYLLDDDTTLA